MYEKPFSITDPVGNNAFSYAQRTHKQLFVPSLKKIESLDEIKLLQNEEEITFEDYDFDDVLQTCRGLENLYEMEWHRKKLFLFDNHNHAYYFWYLARSQGIISDNALLYHIDEHADTRDPETYLLKADSQDIQKVFEYTNFFLNVGNYIVPAEQEGLIGKTIQIRSEEALREYQQGVYKQYEAGRNIILNLDLDFFQPELDFIDNEFKKEVILDIALKAEIITVSTSPFFIEQERALRVFREIFDK